MTTHEVAGEKLAERLRVARDGRWIRVTWRGEMYTVDLDSFRAVLLDLVDGQGNLAVAIDLPDMVAVDLPLLEVLVDIEERPVRRGGKLSVASRIGRWEPADPNPQLPPAVRPTR